MLSGSGLAIHVALRPATERPCFAVASDADTHVLSDKDEEKAANRFAGAFLMPAKHLLDEVGKHWNALDYKEVIGLKRLYRVSGAALLMRVRQLDVITIGRNDRSRSPKIRSAAAVQWRQAHAERGHRPGGGLLARLATSRRR